ncbi:hypothetical protein CISIN_1g041477mg, partial [Citrus sinensis]
IMYFGDVYMPLYVEKKPPRVEVYSLATNSWRTIRNNAGYYANDTFSSVFLNEAVHWFASKTGEESSANVVLLFDFNSEKFGEIMLPIISNLRLIEGCYIWVMREYGMVESWTKQYSIVPRTEKSDSSFRNK